MIIVRDKQFTQTLEQKEFGFKRKAVATIGRFRRNTARKLLDSAKKDIDKAKTAELLSKNSPRLSNPEIDKKLLGEVESRGVEVKKFQGEGKSVYNSKLNRVVYKSGNTDSLAHETGHVINDKNGKGLQKLITEKTNNKYGDIRKKRTSNSFRYVTQVNSNGKFRTEAVKRGQVGQSFKKSIKDLKDGIIGGTIIGMEESTATKRGLNLLKKSGATKDELKTAKTNLKNSRDTYKYNTRAYNKSLLSNAINIKSRRTKL